MSLEALNGVVAHAHEHLASIVRVGHALDQTLPLEAINQAGDSSAGQAGAAANLAGRRRSAGQDQIETFQIGRVDPNLLRHGLAMQDAGRRRTPHGQHQTLRRWPGGLTRYLSYHYS